jgi:hypothetical protein
MNIQQASVQMFRSLAVPMTLAITLIVALGRKLELEPKAPRKPRPSRRGGSARPRATNGI